MSFFKKTLVILAGLAPIVGAGWFGFAADTVGWVAKGLIGWAALYAAAGGAFGSNWALRKSRPAPECLFLSSYDYEDGKEED